MPTLNEVFSTLSMRRRYEVWFLRLGLADGGGAWWFRYLLMNPGRKSCQEHTDGMPVQVWATWFLAGGPPQSFIQGFPLTGLDVSRKGEAPFHLHIAENKIGEDFCQGNLQVDGHTISWNVGYRSTFRTTLSSKGWIGFSRTPHSDAVFSGEIVLDGRTFVGTPLGFGVQGHNSGYRHRSFWRWTHAYFPRAERPATTLEALVYQMPLGLVFRKAVLWHDGQEFILRNLRENRINRRDLQWSFACALPGRLRFEAKIDGRGSSIHHLAYLKTNCSGSFEVLNNSLAAASVVIEKDGQPAENLETRTGAVLEIVG